MVYWLLAARLYSAEAIGISSALLSAMMFIVNLAHLNLPNGLNRFVPGAGNKTKRLILGAYGITVLIAGIASIGFVLGVSYWSPSLAFIKSNWLLSLFFICATMGWAIFVLQDSALTGLRQAVWIPIENLGFALAKILLLVLVAVMLPVTGVFVSWIIPVFFLLPIINWLIFRRVLPNHSKKAELPKEPITVRVIGRFVFADYIASAVWMATTNLLPLLVLETLGAAENAWFYLAWNISYALYLVSRSMGMSLVTEGVTDRSKLAELAYQTLMKSFMIVIPAAAALYLIAPILLQFYGADYALQTTTLLRLFAISAIPGTVITVYTGLLRVQKKMIQLIFVLSGQGIIILGFSMLWMQQYGLNGIGYSWLLTQSIIALAILFFCPSLFIIPWGDQMLSAIQRPKGANVSIANTDLGQSFEQLFEALLTQVAGHELPHNVVIQKQIPTTNDVQVFLVGRRGGMPRAIFKFTTSPAACSALLHHARTLKAHNRIFRAAILGFNIPQLFALHQHKSTVGVLESMLPGKTLQEFIEKKNADEIPAVLEQIVAKLKPLYEIDQTVINLVDEIDHLVNEPIELIAEQLGWLNRTFIGRRLHRLSKELTEALSWQQLSFGPIHGDLCPGNIILDPITSEMTGLIDWELPANRVYDFVRALTRPYPYLTECPRES